MAAGQQISQLPAVSSRLAHRLWEPLRWGFDDGETPLPPWGAWPPSVSRPGPKDCIEGRCGQTRSSRLEHKPGGLTYDISKEGPRVSRIRLGEPSLASPVDPSRVENLDALAPLEM